MSNFGIDAAQLVALFMESVAWGMQCITVTLCVCTLVSKSRDSQRPVNLHLLAYALVLFGLGTLDIGLAVYRNLQAFVYSSGAGAVFGQISDYVTVLRVSRAEHWTPVWMVPDWDSEWMRFPRCPRGGFSPGVWEAQTIRIRAKRA